MGQRIKVFRESHKNLPTDFCELLNTVAMTIERDSSILFNSTNALLDLCNEILETAKLESGKISDQGENFDLHRTFDDLLSLLTPVAHNKNLKLSADIDPNTPRFLKGQRLHLERILLNLMSNALKFTKEGFVKVSIEGEASSLQITVEDSGIGIPKDHFDSIFEHFTKLSASYCEAQYQGSGLGLYTVKQYLNAMNGSIKVESEVDVGTKFSIELPFAIGEPIEEKTPLRQVNQNSKRKEPDENSRQVLVVEDNLALRLAMELVLEHHNHIVDLAETGETTIEKVKTKKYDMIFMDIGLPDTDGMAVTKIIREDPESKNQSTPVIAITAHLAKDKWRECEQAGMQDLMTKPVDPEMLDQLLRGCKSARG